MCFGDRELDLAPFHMPNRMQHADMVLAYITKYAKAIQQRVNKAERLFVRRDGDLGRESQWCGWKAWVRSVDSQICTVEKSTDRGLITYQYWGLRFAPVAEGEVDYQSFIVQGFCSRVRYWLRA